LSENLELRDQAYADYRQGMKYKEIAEKYGVSLSAVKSWAARYWKTKKGCNQSDKKLQSKKKKVATSGAPPGNKNAIGNKGGAAPIGNKNAVTTGEFETLLFDCLDPEEKQLAAAVPNDKEQLLFQEIQLLTVRERRMMKRIENLRQVETESSIAGTYELNVPSGMTVTKYKAGIEKGKITDMGEYSGVLGQIQNIEDALTRVQARKQAAIDSLHRFGVDDARLEIELMKLDMAALKLGGQETEVEEDGFLEALNTEAGDLWGDSDDD
jgi:uncharacterized protein YjcR